MPSKSWGLLVEWCAGVGGDFAALHADRHGAQHDHSHVRSFDGVRADEQFRRRTDFPTYGEQPLAGRKKNKESAARNDISRGAFLVKELLPRVIFPCGRGSNSHYGFLRLAKAHQVDF